MALVVRNLVAALRGHKDSPAGAVAGDFKYPAGFKQFDYVFADRVEEGR
jgi:hypothetical protein